MLSGLLLTEVLLEGWLGRWDVDVEEAFARNRTAGWNDLTALTSAMGDTLTVVAVAGVAAAVLLVWHRWRLAVLLVTALVVEVSVFLTTAAVIDRQRPRSPASTRRPTSSCLGSHRGRRCPLHRAGPGGGGHPCAVRGGGRWPGWSRDHRRRGRRGPPLPGHAPSHRRHRRRMIGAAALTVAVLAVQALAAPAGSARRPEREATVPSSVGSGAGSGVAG